MEFAKNPSKTSEKISDKNGATVILNVVDR